MDVRVGCCGFCMRQEDLFRTFPITEVQQTFYNPPQVRTVERWRAVAPAGHEFSLKAFQAITHHGASRTFRRSKLTDAERAECGMFRDTPTVRGAWDTMRALVRGCEATWVIFQCPLSFAPSDDNVANVRRFFGWADRENARFGWEPRGAAWTADLVAELCRELDLVHVVDPFENTPAWGAPRYFRLHGRTEQPYHYDYRHVYSDEELDQLVAMCADARTYCLFNNMAMAADAQRFQALLERAAVP